MRKLAIVEIRKIAGGVLPRIPFESIAREILGERYELSLVICGDTLARRMNSKYRKQQYAPNVLSFPLKKYEGELFLNVACARREAKAYGVSLRERLALLFVHGCYHLKGFKHGQRMEELEGKTLRRFKLA